FDHPARHGWREQRVAGRDCPDSRNQFFGPGALEQKARRTGPEGTKDVVVLLERRDDQHADVWSHPQQLPRRANSVEVGHANIHQHDIWRQATRALDGLSSGRGLADDFDVRVGRQEFDESGPHQAVVVRDQNPRHRWWPPSGMLAWTRNVPSIDRASSRPPRSVARSRMPVRPCPRDCGGPSAVTGLGTVSSTARSANASSTLAVPAPWRAALVSASCRIRYAA